MTFWAAAAVYLDDHTQSGNHDIVRTVMNATAPFKTKESMLSADKGGEIKLRSAV